MGEMREYEEDVVIATLSSTITHLGINIMWLGVSLLALGYYLELDYYPVRPSEGGACEEING